MTFVRRSTAAAVGWTAVAVAVLSLATGVAIVLGVLNEGGFAAVPTGLPYLALLGVPALLLLLLARRVLRQRSSTR